MPLPKSRWKWDHVPKSIVQILFTVNEERLSRNTATPTWIPVGPSSSGPPGAGGVQMVFWRYHFYTSLLYISCAYHKFPQWNFVQCAPSKPSPSFSPGNNIFLFAISICCGGLTSGNTLAVL